jgi:hypothetical protein
MGDMDVLFEVGEDGLLWSHSRYEGFNRFDNRHPSVLEQAIHDLTGDADYAVAVSQFGGTAQWGYELVEVTYGETQGITWEGDFVQGQRYLAFAERDSGETRIWQFYAARINADGTISADSDSVFRGFDGRTPAQMRELAERSAAWYNR